MCTGCTSWREYVHNGFKVGPNYCRPDAEVSSHWIDEKDLRTAEDPEIAKRWWTVFKDPKLNELVACAYRQNLTLREAGFRILEARATRDIAVGNFFPQTQNAAGNYSRNASSVTDANSPVVNQFSDAWQFGFNLNWELDFWGRFRRAIASTNASLDASVADYDDVLVTLLADVAQNYVTLRTCQERIVFLQENVDLQRKVLKYIQDRFDAGYKQTKLDLDQSTATLRQTEAGIPSVEITQRQAENQLCILLGMPPADLSHMLGSGKIPAVPSEVVLDIPADLLRRRPDVRRAERQAAAQAEQIGIATSDLYPSFYINGSMGYSARNFPDLFKNTSFTGSVGPSFQWDLLNYGRIANNIHYQDAKFQELATVYQNTVLTACKEVENGLITFLRQQRRTKLLDESVAADAAAVETVILQYEKGSVDFNRYATIAQNLVVQQDAAASSRGEISQGLVAVFRALGGGWEIRLEPETDLAEGATALVDQPEPPKAKEPAAMPKPPAEPQPAPMPDEQSKADDQP
ncbi:MAG: efflux transporter outer membrane subunit [Planctomycetaceae bacterium]|nr:efflux transporter outer membrane subunit [Planctomycetaceae bacterium]